MGRLSGGHSGVPADAHRARGCRCRHVRPALRTPGSVAFSGRRSADRCLPGGPVPVRGHLGGRSGGAAVVVAVRPDRSTAGDEDRDLDRRRRGTAGRPEPGHRVAAGGQVLRGRGPGRSARPGDDVPARRGPPSLHRRGRGRLHLRHHHRRSEWPPDRRPADRAHRLATRARCGRRGLPGRRPGLPAADATGPILHPGEEDGLVRPGRERPPLPVGPHPAGPLRPAAVDHGWAGRDLQLPGLPAGGPRLRSAGDRRVADLRRVRSRHGLVATGRSLGASLRSAPGADHRDPGHDHRDPADPRRPAGLGDHRLVDLDRGSLRGARRGLGLGRSSRSGRARPGHRALQRVALHRFGRHRLGGRLRLGRPSAGRPRWRWSSPWRRSRW